MGDLDSAGVALGSLQPPGLCGSEVLNVPRAPQVPPPASTAFLGGGFSYQNYW